MKDRFNNATAISRLFVVLFLLSVAAITQNNECYDDWLAWLRSRGIELWNQVPEILFSSLIYEVLVTRLTSGKTHDVVVVIQPAVVDELKTLSSRTIVLTHRSRGEALQILRAIPGITDSIDDVVAANDIILAALLTGQFYPLIRGGIQKSIFIQMAYRKFGVKPHRISILDDNSANVDGMMAGGCELGILAPGPTITDGRIAPYDLGAPVTNFRLCHGKRGLAA